MRRYERAIVPGKKFLPDKFLISLESAFSEFGQLFGLKFHIREGSRRRLISSPKDSIKLSGQTHRLHYSRFLHRSIKILVHLPLFPS
jgi:hypothetical protein